MKNILLTAVLLAGFIAFAADTKPAAKVDAKTKASPKADAKGKAKGKPAKAKSTAFQAYDAGPWKPVDNKKSHLLGYHISDGDLRHQPVMVVIVDPDQEVSADDRESDPKFIYQFTGWETKVQPHLMVVNVPSRDLDKEEVSLLPKASGKTAAVPGFPWYKNFGLVTEPKNETKTYPFYYVVNAEGQVTYAGNKGKDAQRQVYGDLKKAVTKSGEPHELFGFVKPDIHSNVCANLKLGMNTSTASQKLKALALKGTDESKAEAQALLDALDQQQTYWYRQVLGTMGQNPPQAYMLAQKVVKSYPKNKELKPLVDKIKANASQVLPLYNKLTAIAERMKELADKNEQPKKSDLKKWYPVVCSMEKKVNAAKKSFGDNLPRAFLCLDDLVQTTKAELEAQGAGGK